MRKPSYSPNFLSRRQRILIVLGSLAVAPNSNHTQNDAELSDFEDFEPKKLIGSNDTISTMSSTCDIPEKIEGDSVQRSEESVKEQFQILEDFLVTNGNEIHIPAFKLKPANWAYAKKLGKDAYNEIPSKYCADLDDNSVLSDVLVGKTPTGVTVYLPNGKADTIPIFTLACDLRSENGNKIIGLYRHAPEPHILIKKQSDEDDMYSVTTHEIKHHLNASTLCLSDLEYETTFRADEVLSAADIALLKIDGCHPVDYQFFNEMSADGVQMVQSGFDQSKNEWKKTKLHRADKYRGPYHMIKNIYFSKLGNEEDLNTLLTQLFDEGKISEKETQLVGRALIALAHNGIKGLSIAQANRKNIIAQR